MSPCLEVFSSFRYYLKENYFKRNKKKDRNKTEEVVHTRYSLSYTLIVIRPENDLSSSLKNLVQYAEKSICKGR